MTRVLLGGPSMLLTMPTETRAGFLATLTNQSPTPLRSVSATSYPQLSTVATTRSQVATSGVGERKGRASPTWTYSPSLVFSFNCY